MLPDRFRSSFTSSTLRSLEMLGEKLRVAEPLFFRSAYTANVVEHQRRTFAPLVVLEPSRVANWRCTCSETMRPGDLCRHIAALLVRASDGNGMLAGERFESSLWRAIGFASFSEACSLDSVNADAREHTLRRMVLTRQEQELLQRGSGSTRLQWESSAWYRWSKSMFLRHGDAADARLTAVDTLVVGDDTIHLPPSAVEH
ncbi:MAG TPA: SWIM zinc finger family protein, partial [Thermoanaerobaculia bacterium]|nr:SWIM zinc finger family protein [Thermoanaerobaculia bacterium]